VKDLVILDKSGSKYSPKSSDISFILSEFLNDILPSNANYIKKFIKEYDKIDFSDCYYEKENNKIVMNHLYDKKPNSLVISEMDLFKVIDQWIEIIKGTPDEIVLTEGKDGIFYLKAGSDLDDE